jgi:hypothetical protein
LEDVSYVKLLNGRKVANREDDVALNSESLNRRWQMFLDAQHPFAALKEE